MSTVEKIKAVNNPLTIIAIFAALAEVAGTVSLATVDKSLQFIFIWFVMGFPTLLVVSFLFILYKKPTVLYAPSDFKDEQNFLAIFNAKISVRQIDQLESRLDTAVKQIGDSIAELVHNETDRESIDAAIAKQITPIQKEVADAKKNIDSALLSIAARSDVPDLKEKLAGVRLVNSWIEPRAIHRGKQVEITYEIESLQVIPDGIWLGASFKDASNNFIHNKTEDQRIYLNSGRGLYRRVLSIPGNAKGGSYPIGTNVWYGVVGDGKASKRLNPPDTVKNQIQVLE